MSKHAWVRREDPTKGVCSSRVKTAFGGKHDNNESNDLKDCPKRVKCSGVSGFSFYLFPLWRIVGVL